MTMEADFDIPVPFLRLRREAVVAIRQAVPYPDTLADLGAFFSQAATAAGVAGGGFPEYEFIESAIDLDAGMISAGTVTVNLESIVTKPIVNVEVIMCQVRTSEADPTQVGGVSPGAVMSVQLDPWALNFNTTGLTAGNRVTYVVVAEVSQA